MNSARFVLRRIRWRSDPSSTAFYRECRTPPSPLITLLRRLWQAAYSCCTSQILSTVKIQGFSIMAMRFVTPCSLVDTHRPAVATRYFYFLL